MFHPRLSCKPWVHKAQQGLLGCHTVWQAFMNYKKAHSVLRLPAHALFLFPWKRETMWKVGGKCPFNFICLWVIEPVGCLSKSLLKLILISSEPMIAKDCGLGFGLLLQSTLRKYIKWSEVLKYCMLLKQCIEQIATGLLGREQCKMVVDQVNKEQWNRREEILLNIFLLILFSTRQLITAWRCSHCLQIFLSWLSCGIIKIQWTLSYHNSHSVKKFPGNCSERSP